jgi:hypothetical protein
MLPAIPFLAGHCMGARSGQRVIKPVRRRNVRAVFRQCFGSARKSFIGKGLFENPAISAAPYYHCVAVCRAVEKKICWEVWTPNHSRRLLNLSRRIMIGGQPDG